jgi:hypothetical protein
MRKGTQVIQYNCGWNFVCCDIVILYRQTCSLLFGSSSTICGMLQMYKSGMYMYIRWCHMNCPCQVKYYLINYHCKENDHTNSNPPSTHARAHTHARAQKKSSTIIIKYFQISVIVQILNFSTSDVCLYS